MDCKNNQHQSSGMNEQTVTIVDIAEKKKHCIPRTYSTKQQIYASKIGKRSEARRKKKTRTKNNILVGQYKVVDRITKCIPAISYCGSQKKDASCGRQRPLMDKQQKKKK